MKPTGNATLCLEKSSDRRWWRRRRKKRHGRIRPTVARKRQGEADNEPDAQPDDDNRKVPDTSWSTRGEYPNDKVFYPNLGTSEYPYPPTKEIARMWELDKTPRATMGRTRSNSL